MKSILLATLAATAFLLPTQSFAQRYNVSVDSQYSDRTEGRGNDREHSRDEARDEGRNQHRSDQAYRNQTQWNQNDRGGNEPRYSRPQPQQNAPVYGGDVRVEGRYEQRRDDRREYDRGYGRHDDYGRDRDHHDRDRGGGQYRDQYRGYGDNGWNSGWRNDRRYDWRSNRDRYGDRYRQGRYYGPQYGGSYGRISIGVTIGSPYYSSRYWVNNPEYYRLPPAYGAYRWVRYGQDALLVDIRSGYVVDMINNFFW